MSFEKKNIFIMNATNNYAPTMIKTKLLVPSKIEFFFRTHVNYYCYFLKNGDIFFSVSKLIIGSDFETIKIQQPYARRNESIGFFPWIMRQKEK